VLLPTGYDADDLELITLGEVPPTATPPGVAPSPLCSTSGRLRASPSSVINAATSTRIIHFSKVAVDRELHPARIALIPILPHRIESARAQQLAICAGDRSSAMENCSVASAFSTLLRARLFFRGP
jgi:hypothetical protein